MSSSEKMLSWSLPEEKKCINVYPCMWEMMKSLSKELSPHPRSYNKTLEQAKGISFQGSEPYSPHEC